jgi:hypothetical protein
MYFYFTSLVAANTIVIQVVNHNITDTVLAALRLTSAGKVVLLYNGTTIAATSSTTLATGQWYRLELSCTSGTGTAGSATLRIYATNPDAATGSYDEQLTTGGVNTGTASAQNRAYFGAPGSAGNSQFYIDDAAWSDAGWIGPTTPVDSGAATIAGSPGLTAAGLVVEIAAGSLAVASALAADSSVTEFGAASLAQASSLSDAGSDLEQAAATVGESSGLTASGLRLTLGAATLVETPGLAAAATLTIPGVSSLAETPALSAAGFQLASGSASLAEVSAISAAGSVVQLAGASLAQAAALAATAVLTIPGAATLTGLSALAATGTAAPAQDGSATLAESIGLTADGYVIALGSLPTLAETSSLGADGQVIVLGSIALTVASGVPDTASSVQVYGPAHLAELAGLTTVAFVTVRGDAQVAAVANLMTNGSITSLAGANLTGSSLVTVAGLIATAGGASLLVAPGLVVAGKAIVPGEVAFDVISSSHVNSVIGLETGVARISARARLAVSGVVSAHFAPFGWQHFGSLARSIPADATASPSRVFDLAASREGDQ